MPKRQHQPLSINKLFKQRQFMKFEQHLNQQHDLQGLGLSVLSEFKLDCCRLSSFRQGVIEIEAPSAAWLNRLKQFRFELLSQFRQLQPSVVSIDFKVNPQLSSIKPEVEQKSIGKRQLSPTAAKHITEMAQQMPKELKEKLEKLAALSGEKSSALQENDD